jgi:hypothetical protein
MYELKPIPNVTRDFLFEYQILDWIILKLMPLHDLDDLRWMYVLAPPLATADLAAAPAWWI